MERKRVLIIDEGESAVGDLPQQLQQMGYVVTAVAASEADPAALLAGREGPALLVTAVDRRQIEAELRYHLEFEQVLTSLAIEFINLALHDLDQTINRMLATIGAFIQADYSYALFFSPDGRHVDKIYEWRADAAPPRRHLLQQITPADYPWAMAQLRRRDLIRVLDPADLPDDAASERRLLQEYGVQSIIVVPIQSGLTSVTSLGYLGFASIHPRRDWSQESLTLLRLVGEIVTNALQRCRLEQELRHQERLAAVGHLAAGVAHDFNNILASITLYAQLLQQNHELPPRGAQHLATISQQAARGAELVQQVLDFSRSSVLSLEIVDLAAFLEQMKDLLRRILTPQVALEIVCEVASERSDSCLVRVDPLRLQQVLVNMARNSRDALPQGGRFQIHLGCVDSPSAQLAALAVKGGRWLCLTISDDGPGISEIVAPHLFEPFFTTKPPGQGAGLGLAQVYGIVTQHGGHIMFHERGGEAGATFSIYLPALVTQLADAPAPEPAAAELWPVDLPPSQVGLVVQAEPVMQEALRDMLEMWRFHALAASDGREALQLTAAWQGELHLLITDWMSSPVATAELYQTLRARWPELKMIVVNTFSAPPAKEQFVPVEAVTWLRKPFTVDELAIKISALLHV